MLLDPLSSVTPSRTPSLDRDALYGRPPDEQFIVMCYTDLYRLTGVYFFLNLRQRTALAQCFNYNWLLHLG